METPNDKEYLSAVHQVRRNFRSVIGEAVSTDSVLYKYYLERELIALQKSYREACEALKRSTSSAG